MSALRSAPKIVAARLRLSFVIFVFVSFCKKTLLPPPPPSPSSSSWRALALHPKHGPLPLPFGQIALALGRPPRTAAVQCRVEFGDERRVQR